MVAPPAGSTTTVTTTFWPMMTLSEYELLAAREQHLANLRANESLRHSMQLFDLKVAVRNFQRMHLPDPLPDSWQLAPAGSATTLPARLALPSPAGMRRSARPASLPDDFKIGQ